MSEQATEQKDIEPVADNPQRRTISALRHELVERTDPGTLAALRRMDPTTPPPAFYRIATRVLDELPGSQASLEAETRWALLLKAMAMAVGRKGSYALLAPIRFGEALAKAQISEMRVMRLLAAHDEALPDLLRGLIHQLVSKGQPFDPNDLGRFLLSTGDHRERARRSIARDYYRHHTD